jgi:chromosome segregation ATPase
MLQRHVAELEKANTQLEASNAEMQLTPSRSREAVTMLRRELDAELENYELLRVGNSRLLDEVRGQVADLESKLTETKVNADKDTAALEARLAAAETHAAEGSATVERRFEVVCTKRHCMSPVNARFRASRYPRHDSFDRRLLHSMVNI